MDDTEDRVLVVATVNRPKMLPAEILRRFKIMIIVGLPCARSRRFFFADFMAENAHVHWTPDQVEELVKKSKGFTLADIGATFSRLSAELISALLLQSRSPPPPTNNTSDDDREKETIAKFFDFGQVLKHFEAFTPESHPEIVAHANWLLQTFSANIEAFGKDSQVTLEDLED
jgi:SpoVK/Ycf46/Vps4 family AAA+-type ATPase